MSLKKVVFGSLFVLLLAGCAQSETPTTAQTDMTPTVMVDTVGTVLPTTTASPGPTATPTITPTPTVTPTPFPTPTPTPTAMPLSVSGDPRAAQVATPEYTSRYPCGAVDLFDFPLDPPDADTLSSGRDFGIYRSRYEKYHAGEDWWFGRGSSFGKPVFAIGHGLVTYAEPEGWGRDKGVVIVQHTKQDGSQVLSFYGHLDPPSVTLTAGECVTRGEKIGEIGRPRTSPHLHFEMRTQSPWATLTGYWPEDPTTVGWLPPSQTIWEQRMSVALGVAWTKPFSATEIVPIGSFSAENFILLEQKQLLALNPQNGQTEPLLPEIESRNATLLNRQENQLVIADFNGRLDAFQQSASNWNRAWSAEMDVSGVPSLLPTPNGGVIAVWRDEVASFSAEGDLLWQQSVDLRPYSSVLHTDQLYFSTLADGGHVWVTDGNNFPVVIENLGGKVIFAENDLWIYAMEGIFRLQDGADSAELIYELPAGLLQRGDIVAVPDGGVLVAHADARDRRLLFFDGDGNLQWQRSYADSVIGDVDFVLVGGDPYVVATDNSGSLGSLNVYALDLLSAELQHIFTGGTRDPRSKSWAMPISDSELLINVGGGPMALLSVAIARGSE